MIDKLIAAVQWAIDDLLAAARREPRSEPDRETYRLLLATGAWWWLEAADVAIAEALGDITDPAECDDTPDDWHSCGTSAWWLDKHADDPPRFILGVPAANWLWEGNLRGPVMISISRLKDRKSRFPPSTVPVYIDSGGFTEVTSHGGHRLSPEEYARLIRRLVDELGSVEWATVQDWMCEPFALAATGLTVEEHQRRTVESYLRLREIDPTIHWLPVIQGYRLADYTRHVAMYREAGVWLGELRSVGVGSVCKRNREPEILAVLANLQSDGALPMRLHGFGVKAEGLHAAREIVWTADSMAWSARGRVLSRDADAAKTSGQGTLDFFEPNAGRDAQGSRLSWSLEFAEAWREKMEGIAAAPPMPRRAPQPEQMDLLDEG